MRVADTRAVKLTSLVASFKIWIIARPYQRNDVVIDFIFRVAADQLDHWLDSSLPDNGFIMLAEIFELGKYQGMLGTKEGSTLGHKNYAMLASSSAIGKTTSSSSFLTRLSSNGSRVFLMASVDMRVAMMGILWTVLTRTERSSLSSSSLKN